MSDDAWASKAEYDEHKRNDESAGDMADDEASPRADREWEEDAMHMACRPLTPSMSKVDLAVCLETLAAHKKILSGEVER